MLPGWRARREERGGWSARARQVKRNQLSGTGTGSWPGEGRNMFAHDHEVTMGGADAPGLGWPRAAADAFRRSLAFPPDGLRVNYA